MAPRPWLFLFAFLIFSLFGRSKGEKSKIVKLWDQVKIQNRQMTTDVVKDGKQESIPFCTRAELGINSRSTQVHWAGANNVHNEAMLVAMWEKIFWVGRVAKTLEREAYGSRLVRLTNKEAEDAILDQLVGGAEKPGHPDSRATPTLYHAVQNWKAAYGESFDISKVQLYFWMSSQSLDSSKPSNPFLLDAFDKRIRAEIPDAASLKTVLYDYRKQKQDLLGRYLLIARISPDAASLWMGESEPIWTYPAEC